MTSQQFKSASEELQKAANDLKSRREKDHNFYQDLFRLREHFTLSGKITRLKSGPAGAPKVSGKLWVDFGFNSSTFFKLFSFPKIL
jgi:hypothetical protein